MSECTNGEMRDLLPELVNGRLDAEMQRTSRRTSAECEECAEELALLAIAATGAHARPLVDASSIAAAVHAQTCGRVAT